MPTAQMLERLRATVRTHWGFDQFRPLQERAISAALDGRDSVVVVPTGGGKSLCYQAPATMQDDGLTVVISPLIALMKDQVDALLARRVPSALYNSSVVAAQKREIVDGITANRYRLLYVAPERLADEHFLHLLRETRVYSVAVDEAHCISHWGHDFRPDYRRLQQLKEWFPGASVHAFTATATPRVRQDIVQQLSLNDPEVIVGEFDRPNLAYRVKRRSDLHGQVCDIIDANRAGGGIVYCIRRDDVDALSDYLRGAGYRALPYHAGIPAEQRKRNQDDFTAKKIEIIVATVAFGMGIDRPDIRYVLHTGMPKSIEAYQQETGRAGRDGLPAECTLFYTGADFMTWKSICEKTATDHLDIHMTQLRKMLDYCQSPVCRHRHLVNHFGQDYPNPTCGACDVCLDEIPILPESTTVAMKILSAVVRTGERFGGKYVADVLVGADTQDVQKRGHESLSVFGLMEEHAAKDIRAWIDQLAALGFLRVGTEYRTFSLSPEGCELLRGQGQAKLFVDAGPRTARAGSRPRRPAQRPAPIGSRSESPRRVARYVVEGSSDQGDGDVDAVLYEALRTVRKQFATAGNLPLYCIVSNKTLADIARNKPTSEDALLTISGIGPKKQAQFGDAFLECVRTHRDSLPAD